MDTSSLVAGLVAYAVSVVASVLLVFVTYRLNTLLTSKIDEERLLLSGHRSIAVALGAVVLSQALLLRHAVFPTMAVIRDLFVRPVSPGAAFWVVGHCLLFFVIIGILSFGSVAIAAWLFSRMTRSIPEHEEILKDNLAIAIFFAFVLLGITAIVNEGLEDLSRSIIPYAETGVVRVR
jgi:uncharacterized membrane protein YjfL (UPF0719 family)